MIVHGSRAAAGAAVFLFGSLLHAQVTLKPEKRNDMEAELTVRAAERTAEQGLGEVTLTQTVKGPITLEVEQPHLGDPTAAWKEERRAPTQTIQDGRKTWCQVIRLKQSKKGVETVPDVSLRFRDGPNADWEEAKWVDILKELRDGPLPPQPPPPQASWLRRWGPMFALGVAALLLGAWMMKRRRGRREPPLPPDQWALRELDRIERTLMPPRGDAEIFHTQLSQVVRRYLAERYVPHALQQTTAEFLEAVRQVPQLPAEQQERLRDLFERCDLAKFARVSTPPEECQRTAEMVRELVRHSSEPAA
jgi:hypothetical protein